MNATKRKDNKASGQFDRTSDDEIQAELAAMANLEYNLHSDYEMLENEWTEITEVPVVGHSLGKKSRTQGTGSTTGATTTRGESRSVDNENFVQAYVPQASTEELRSLIRRAATTCEDRYKILEARDRLMRAKRQKTRVSTSRGAATKGTCPDMCPEKERLMREFQRQVASYELLGGPEYAINHAVAIKQYSRSSADQEEPLPHDLRPVGSLEMTMSYLLCEIADLCEDKNVGSANLAEWYHFLWDRTRAIRKDITQQELCCPKSVRLVEQCARFHIICAERLCAEEPSVFDKKINTENLTKCLQTLKYMYNDLRIQGIVCDNEPEFRAYVVLLNLNNANFMWDVARLPAKVQKSAEMRFAVKIYSCLESNNYAKFFRLVGETTYLNACILLRYFNQVRAKALSVMVKAYCRTSSTAFPLYELIDVLGFEDENEAVSFCERLGLGLSTDELHVMLDRRNFCPSSGNMAQRRARNYVESKRRTAGRSIGLCIAGERMPEKLYEGHRPHDSFDSQGYLKSESVDAEDQNVEKLESEERDSGSKDETAKTETSRGDDPMESDELVFSSVNDATDATTIRSNSPVVVAPTAASPIAVLEKIHDSSKQLDRSDDKSGVSIFGNTFKRDETIGNFAQTCGNFITAASNATTATPFSFSAAAAAAAAAATTPAVASSPPEERELLPCEKTSDGIFGAPRVPNIFAKSRDKTFETKKASIFAGKAYNIFGNEGNLSRKEKIVENANDSTTTKITEYSENIPNRIEKTVQLAEKRRQEQKQQRNERVEIIRRERRIEEDAERIYARLEKKIVEDFCQIIVREEKDRACLVDDSCELILREIIDECVGRECDDTLNREIGISRKIDEFTRRTRKRIVMKYYRVWREFARRKGQERCALEETPVWLQPTSLDDRARSLYRDEQRYAIENIKRKRLKVDDYWSTRIRDDCMRRRHLESLVGPLEYNIYEGLKENARILDVNLTSIVYWKMIVSWPSASSSSSRDRHDERAVLEQCRRIFDEYVCPSERVRSYRPNSCEQILRVCINEDSNLARVERDDARGLGSDGILFVTSPQDDAESLVQRLNATIYSRRKLMPVPVMALVLTTRGCSSSSRRSDKLERQLDRLQRSGYVSEYLVRDCRVNSDESVILKETRKASHWLAVNKSPPVPLEMDFSRNILDTCLTEELWLRILGDSSFNEHLCNALRDINFVIELHNEAVFNLIDILLDPESLAYTDFPAEFRDSLPKRNESRELPCTYENFDSTWRGQETRSRLEQDAKQLLLPKWSFEWPIGDPNELEECLVRYREQVSCKNVTLESEEATLVATPATAAAVNFIQILLVVVKEKIGNLEPGITAVYNKNHVKHFRNSPWWFKSSTLGNYHREEEQRVAVKTDRRANSITPTAFIPHRTRSPIRALELDTNMEIEETIKRYELSVDSTIDRNVDREIRTRISELRLASDRLEKTLTEQKNRSRLLDDKLSLALAESTGVADH